VELIDVCVNVTNAQFREDRAAVIERADREGVVGMLFTATDLDTARASLAIADGDRQLCTAGIHPHDAKDAPSDWQDTLRELAQHPSVRAIGECGLDFNRNFSPREVQIEIFNGQIEAAKALDLPLFVHDRDSEGAVLDRLLRQARLPPTVIHCFTGSAGDLRRYTAEGFYIGITGWLCDRRRGDTLRNLVPEIPLDRLLVETDAPFLKPHNAPDTFHETHGVPKRRNEPALLAYIVEMLAEVRPESADDIAAATMANACDLFGFKSSQST
jgi:TatD DNase family protein